MPPLRSRTLSATTWLLFVAVGMSAQQPAPRQPSAYEELQTFSAVLNHIRVNYMDSVTYTQLVRAAIDGVLQALDPHSRFESYADRNKAAKLQRRELAVTGLVLENVDGVASVLAVMLKSPADKAGLQPGDRLTFVDDTTVAGLDARALELKLSGDKGSKVRLRFERGPRLEPDTFSVTLKRDYVKVSSVSIVRLVDPTTGFVRLEEFGEKAASEVHDALKRLRGQGATQFILDLRRNPGGVVRASVELASEFFPKNTVVFSTRGRKKEVDTTYVTKRDGEFTGAPLIVLVDGGSASAAEALADSFALTLPATPPARTAWMNARAEWGTRLVNPLLERVRSRFHVAAQPDSMLAARIGRNLALRVAEVRWGPDARDEFLARNDPDVRAATDYFRRLPELLGGPK